MQARENKVLNLYPIDYPFETLISRVNGDKLILNPDFQRKYKWDKDGYEKCSKFIESCLMRIPLPACYFAETQDDKHLVIDGVQRITTIKKFFSDEFELEGLTVFSELNGKKFSQLGRYKSELESTTIRCVILRKENPDGLIQEIFSRLNQGSVILSAQEIRHAIFPGLLNDLLGTLSQHTIIMKFKPHDDSKAREELVLRFFALDNDLTNYNDNLSKYLDAFMQTHKGMSQIDVDLLRGKFDETIEKCVNIFGDNAFSNLSKRINRKSAVLYDLQMYGFTKYSLPELMSKKTDIITSFTELCGDQSFAKLLSARILNRTSILERREAWSVRLVEILGH